MPFAVVVRSIVARLRPRARLTVHVLDTGVDRADRERLSAFCAEAGVELHLYPVDLAAVAGLPTWGRMTRSTYARLLMAQFLPVQLDRVVWLDCDLLVEADLARLWETSLDGNTVLAVQDILVPRIDSAGGIRSHALLGLPSGAAYFNAGVMLVDLGRWRDDDVAGQALAYLDTQADDVQYWDQEALNAVLPGRWGQLDHRWNQNASVTGRPFLRVRHLDQRTYALLERDPWILHFSGRVKPWLVPDPGHGPRHRFFELLDETPWAGWRPHPTVAQRLTAAYDSSRVRNLTYPAEAWAVSVGRRWSRRT